MVSFTTVAAFAAGAIAAPLNARQADIPSGWNWHVSNWEAGCAQSGCTYNFNITVPTVDGQIAGVKAYCNGGETSDFTACQIIDGVNNGVSAMFSPRTSNDGTGPKDIMITFEKAAWMDGTK